MSNRFEKAILHERRRSTSTWVNVIQAPGHYIPLIMYRVGRLSLAARMPRWRAAAATRGAYPDVSASAGLVRRAERTTGQHSDT